MPSLTKPADPDLKLSPAHVKAQNRVTKIGIERFAKIVALIQRRGVVTMAQLKGELEVSQASVKRDLEFLRDRLGCPIEWDPKRRGYVIHNDAAGGRFELPGVWFDSSETLALLTMLHLVEGMQPGLLKDHVAPLKQRLRKMLAEGTSTLASIEQKVKLIHFAQRKVEPRHFQQIASALLRGKRLRIQYWNREKGEHTDRELSPQQLVHYRENWLLDAWCHERGALRTFALEAIESATESAETALAVTPEEMRAHFEGGYGIFAGPALHRARLRFSAQRARWVAAEHWHHDQTSEFLPDGSYILEVPYSNDQELLMDILRHSPEVEVLAPSSLRAKLHSALSAAVARNAGDASD